MSKKILRIGLDFDGVVAYNPFRVVRAPWAFFKRHILGVKKLTFFYPKNSWQRLMWIIVHESSVFPADGVELLRELVKSKKIEVFLITGRFKFLNEDLHQWLGKYHLESLFKNIYVNVGNEQPHLFKEKMLKKLKLVIFVEDNLDIVEYLDGRTSTKIYWIYNITDHFHPYRYKFPFLKRALEALPLKNKNK